MKANYSTEDVLIDQRTDHARAYFAIMKLSSNIDLKVKNALKVHKLTHAQLNILSLLFNNNDQPLSLTEIKEKLIVNSPDLSRLVDRLVAKKLVNRLTCPTNRRKIDILITKKGAALFKKAHVSAKESVDNFFQSLTTSEAKLLKKLILKINL